MTRHILIPIALILVFGVSPVNPVNPADAGPQLSYQGVVQDSEGTPLNETRSVNFRIYSTTTGGTALWSENHTITFVDGVFDAVLGLTAAMDGLPWEQSLWLEVLVEGFDPFAPRTAILPAPFSLRVEKLDPSSVRSSNISTGAVTSTKIGDDTVVRSLNGLTDVITISAGNNITITPTGNDLQISGAGAVGDLDWQINGNDISSIPTGNVGIGDATPNAKLSILGGQSDLGSSDGDLVIGSDAFKLKFGISTAGPTAGTASIWAVGGGNRLRLGSQDHDVVEVGDESVDVYDNTGQRTVRILGATDRTISPNPDVGGEIQLFRTNGTMTVDIDAEDLDDTESAGGKVALSNGAGVETLRMFGQEGVSSSEGAAIFLGNEAGDVGVRIDGDKANLGGAIQLRDETGAITVRIDANYAGTGRVITEVLEITGGADLSENFDTTAPDLKPGTVVCIDPKNPGLLKSSDRPYDRRVAGVVSGAGGVRPGMLMGQAGSAADGAHPVALSGRVYVRADASNGPIEPGDLLTTSSLAGHAMKVLEPSQANGAILGKAMSSLAEGQGLVLILVSLQ